MLFTAERLRRSRKPSSANSAFTRSWQSSKVPSTAMLCTLGASTVVICRRCTSETRPAGWRMNDVDRGAVAEGLDGGRAGVARRGPDDGDPLAPTGELVVEEAPDQLQGDVLERQGGPVEDLGQPHAVAEVGEGHDVGRVEGGVGVGHDRGEGVAVEGAFDEGPHDLGGDLGVGHRGEAAEGADRERRPFGRHVEAAVAGEPGEQDVGEAQLGRRAPGADVGEPAHDSASSEVEHLDDAADLVHDVEARAARRAWPAGRARPRGG